VCPSSKRRTDDRKWALQKEPFEQLPCCLHDPCICQVPLTGVRLAMPTHWALVCGSAVTSSIIDKQTNIGFPFFDSRRKTDKWPVFVQVCRSHDVSSTHKIPLYPPLSRPRHRLMTSLLYVCTFMPDTPCCSEHTGSRFLLNVRNVIRRASYCELLVPVIGGCLSYPHRQSVLTKGTGTRVNMG
jgi:hypothetical protein